MYKFLIGLIILFASCAPTKSNPENNRNRIPPPEEFGFDSEILSNLINGIKEEKLNVNSLLIRRNNVTILDAHFYPQKSEDIHDVASISKSITSLLVGIAIEKGFIDSVDQKMIDFFPEDTSFFDTPSKKELTIEHLLTMTSGICSDFSQGENMREKMKTDNSSLAMLLTGDLVTRPGERFAYCSPGVQLLSMIIQKSSRMSLESFAVKHLFDPLGITDYRFGADLNGYSNASGDIFLKAKDLAKIGQLILDHGSYDGNQIISNNWVTQSITPKSSPNEEESYGYLWWLREDLGGLIEAQGRGGQRLIILPEKDIVIVMFGTGFDTGSVGAYIVEALKSDNPLEPNEEGNILLKKALKDIQHSNPENVDILTPEIAKKLCDKKYVFDENSIGLTHFILCVENPDSAFFTLGLDIKTSNEKGERKIPIGMDGNYKISNMTRFKTPMAARAKWIDDQSISIDYNEFSNAHKYEIKIEFEKDRARFWIRDEADYGEASELSAKAKE